ncbi:rhodanese-like domain-containing protein [Patescibacteria group bacterium]
MKKILFIVIPLVLIFGGGYYYLGSKDTGTDVVEESEVMEEAAVLDEYIDLSPSEFYQFMVDDSDAVVLDVSPKFDEGRLPNAINHYVGDGSLDRAIPTLNKELTYLVYCHVDSASILGAQKLVNAGFPRVYRLVDNYSAWVEAGFPIEVSINAVGDYVGDGSATMGFYNDTFVHTLWTDLEDPPTGKFYEGWLVHPGTRDFFSTGELKSIEEGYILEYTSSTDYRDYAEVVVTEETFDKGLDGVPEIHVLEGSF